MKRLSVVSLLLAACTSPAPDRDDVGARDQAIIGGTAATDDHAVVLLASYPSDRSVLATCTAVVIAPTVLATAAHCVDAASHPGYTFGAFLDEDASIYPRLVDLEPHLVAVTAVHAHPDYSTAAPFHADIGVAILAAPLTGVTPIELWRGDVAALVGGPARIVGYGQAVVGQFSATRRQAATVVAGVDTGDDTVRVGSAGHVTCLGDSGGPALVPATGGAEQLLGVDSYADNGACDRPAHFRRADVYQGWLDSYTGDAPPIDAGVDAGTTGPDAGGGDSSDDGGCATGGGGALASVPLILGLAFAVRRRRR